MQHDVATRRVIGFAVAFAVVELAAAAFVATRSTATLVGIVVFGLIGLAVVVGLLISIVQWVWTTVRETRELGAPPYRHLGIWGVGAFAGLWALGYAAPGGIAVQVAVRLLGLGLLVGGVLHTRAWLDSHADPDRPRRDDGSSMSPRPTAGDWDASAWDPEVLSDIERRRRHDP
jgi:hypothetical protein